MVVIQYKGLKAGAFLMAALVACGLLLAGCTDGKNTGNSAPAPSISVQPQVPAPADNGSSGAEGNNVPEEQLAAFAGHAKKKMQQELGIEVPDRARITFSEYDEAEESLHFSWTLEEGGETLEYFSAGYDTVDLANSAGNLMYLRARGAQAGVLAAALATQAASAMEGMLEGPLPEGLQLVADVELYRDARSVLFSWEKDISGRVAVGGFYAGYERVDEIFSTGTLVYLEAMDDEETQASWEQVPYTSEEVEALLPVAQAYAAKVDGIGAYEFVAAEPMNPMSKSPLVFGFNLIGGSYAGLYVTVNADGGVMGFALADWPIENAA